MASGLGHLLEAALPYLVGAAVFLLVFRLILWRKAWSCDWRKARDGDKGTLVKYRCATCGYEAFTATGKPPVGCKKDLKPKPL